MKKLIYWIILLAQLFLPVWAQGFVVRDIEIQGLQRVSAATVRSYLPIKPGQTLQPSQTAAVLRSLYQTGFFEHITLSKENGTLIIHVLERPTIGKLSVTGNSIIQTDKLTGVMRSLDIAEGRIYNPVVIEKIKQSLLNQYYQLGYYNARVEISTRPMPRNRVAVNIYISEGVTAKIRRISIIGNRAFSDKTLLNQLDITTSGLFTFFTQSDRYSEAKLEENLEKLRSYYLDRGYLRFEIKSAQTEITPDRKSIYINIVVSEGEVYTIKGDEIQGEFVVPREELEKLVTINPGERFSRQKVIDIQKAITKRLGDEGYLFSSVALRPTVDDRTREVFLTFVIHSGKRTYVRRVTFSDNNRTNDVVLRREVEQWESAPASTAKIEESTHRLKLLPFIKDVEMSVSPVPAVEDQVDVNYKVVEDSSATATFKIGYSQLFRTLLGVGFNQKNFFGTGNTFGINLTRSRYEQFYQIDFTDPYYTPDGISRSFNFSLSRVDPRGAGISSDYTSNEYDLSVLYGIPVGQEIGVINRLQAGIGYQNTLVNLSRDHNNISNQINSFVNRHGRHFQELDVRLGYSRDSRDRAIFPTTGGLQTLFLDGYAPVDRNSLSFYTVNYHGRWYRPLNDKFLVTGRMDLGYGNGFHGIRDFPFFRNYYAGGIGSVRGYQGFTLGPRDSNDRPYGGNMLADASLGLIFPNYLSDNLRTTLFVDAGNVYTSLNNRKFGGSSTDSGPIRYSTGIQAEWITPLGPITLSLAKTLNRQTGRRDNRGDFIEPFQFALGTNF